MDLAALDRLASLPSGPTDFLFGRSARTCGSNPGANLLTDFDSFIGAPGFSSLRSLVSAVTLLVLRTLRSASARTSGSNPGAEEMLTSTSCRGAARIRTGDKGFAVLCLTTWPRRRKPCYKGPKT